jgi:hypothetical protein
MLLGSRARSFTLTRRRVKQYQREKLRRQLERMRKCWKMFSVTREAFVAQVSIYLDYMGADGRVLYEKVLLVPDTCLVDVDSCRADLDEVFANRVLDAAQALYAGVGTK